MASEMCGIRCDPDSFADDITHIACLMQVESLSYQFIHKSVAEYHAAVYISEAPEETAKLFYEKVFTYSKWPKWRQELIFLEEIDRYRYLKYFYVPCTNWLLRLKGELNTGSPEDREKTIVDLLNRFQLIIPPHKASSIGSRGTQFYMRHMGLSNPAESLFEGGLTGRLLTLCATIPEIPTNDGDTELELRVGDLFSELHILSKAIEALTSALSTAEARAKDAAAEIQRDDDARQFLDP
jgi:hypothetical protein